MPQACSGGGAADFFQNFRERNHEYDCAAYGCSGIGYAFGGEHSFDAPETGKEQGQRDEQYNFPEQGYEKGNLCLSEGNECVLAGSLKSEYCHAGQKYRHHLADGGLELAVRSEHGCHPVRENNQEQHHGGIEGEHGDERDSETFPHPCSVAVPVVVACDRDEPLGKSCNRNTSELHCALKYRK